MLEFGAHPSAGRPPLRFEVAYTPGHASHHVSYLHEGTAFVGDVGGVRITPKTPPVPPTPPPDIDVELWHRSLEQIAAWAPERLAMTHFGASEDVEWQLADVGTRLDRIARARQRNSTADAWIDAVRAELPRRRARPRSSRLTCRRRRPIRRISGCVATGTSGRRRPTPRSQITAAGGILGPWRRQWSFRASAALAAASAACGASSFSTTITTPSTTSRRRLPGSCPAVSLADGYRFADRIHRTGCAIVWSGARDDAEVLLGGARRRRPDDGATRDRLDGGLSSSGALAWARRRHRRLSGPASRPAARG